MRGKIRVLSIILLLTFCVHAQNVTTSPYSIFGLGSLYVSDFGSSAAMGSTGIAIPSSTFINNKNPASLAFINSNSFFFDVGAKSIVSTFQDNTRKEKKNNFQFSHLALAFPINTKSGVSIALKPYSSASYNISGYKLKIQNSDEYYYLFANSSGGLNCFDVSYGRKISKKMALGVTSSIYFGSIDDNKSYIVANSFTSTSSTSTYSGIRLMLANQYTINPTFVIGSYLKSPAIINANAVSDSGGPEESFGLGSGGMTYFLPLEMGIGFNKQFKKNWSVAFDYELSLWKGTNQYSIYSEYGNQNRFSLGLSYFKNKRSSYLSERLHYFSGINYDSGFLLINNQRVNNFAFSCGIGIPVEKTKSLINISYSYGIKGRITNDLIKENYHKIGLNLSLEAIWFVKRKFD